MKYLLIQASGAPGSCDSFNHVVETKNRPEILFIGPNFGASLFLETRHFLSG